MTNSVPDHSAVANSAAPARVLPQALALLEAYRDRCLWFARPDYVPQSVGEWMNALDAIERYGDRAGYRQAQEIRKWLLQPSKAAS